MPSMKSNSQIIGYFTESQVVDVEPEGKDGEAPKGAETEASVGELEVSCSMAWLLPLLICMLI